MGRIVGIVSLKGGVGKTTSVVSLAYALKNVFDKKVLVVDGNFSAPNLGLHVGVAGVNYTIHDVLSNKCLVSEAVYDHEYGFSIMPGALNYSKVDSKSLKGKLAGIQKYFDLVLVDTSPTINEDLANVMAACDELYCVTTPDYPTLAATLRAVGLAKEKGWAFQGIILNMDANKNYGLSVKDIEEAAGVKVIGAVKDDVKVLKALADVKPVGMFKPYSTVALDYNSVAAHLIDESYKKPNIFVRLLKSL